MYITALAQRASGVFEDRSTGTSVRPGFMVSVDRTIPLQRRARTGSPTPGTFIFIFMQEQFVVIRHW